MSYGASSVKRPRRTKAQVEALRAELYALVETAQPCSVRHAYYLGIGRLWGKGQRHLAPELLGRRPRARRDAGTRDVAVGVDHRRHPARTAGDRLRLDRGRPGSHGGGLPAQLVEYTGTAGSRCGARATRSPGGSSPSPPLGAWACTPAAASPAKHSYTRRCSNMSGRASPLPRSSLATEIPGAGRYPGADRDTRERGNEPLKPLLSRLR